MAQNTQRGSIISFVVVGVVLTALVVGGIYLAKHYLPSDAPAQVAQTDTDKDGDTNDSGTADDKDAKNPSDDSKNTDANTTDDKAAAEREAEAARQREAQQKAEQDAAAAQAEDDEADSEGTAADESAKTGVLPQTGPAETAMTGVALAAITGSIVAYRRSRQGV